MKPLNPLDAVTPFVNAMNNGDLETALGFYEPDKELDEIWAEESDKRLKAYREGRLEGIPMEDIFKEE